MDPTPSPGPAAAAPDPRPVIVVGAGLAGSLLAILLADQGLAVEVYERRPDLRVAALPGGRSINLALSTRGLRALSRVGLDAEALSRALPMSGRQLHDPDGREHHQPYGQPGQVIHSVERHRLNALLLDAAASRPGVTLHFQHRCTGVDLEAPAALFFDQASGAQRRVEGQLVIGADGAFSAVRDQMQRNDRYDYQQDFLDTGYKELTIPPRSDGGFALDPRRLHIWPRQRFMLIALPNADRSFTCTLFLPFEGPVSFAALDRSPEAIEPFFAQHFPDARPLIADLVDDFCAHPTGSLVTIRCQPFHHADRVLLIGDAAHAIVPFFGQGMNAAFEDCDILADLIARHGPRWSEVLPRFSLQRKPDADAISDLALAHFNEMRAHVASPLFLLRKRLEATLHRLLPEAWIPLYTMVTFTSIPYAEARARSARQDRWLNVALFIALTLTLLALLALARRG